MAVRRGSAERRFQLASACSLCPARKRRSKDRKEILQPPVESLLRVLARLPAAPLLPPSIGSRAGPRRRGIGRRIEKLGKRDCDKPNVGRSALNGFFQLFDSLSEPLHNLVLRQNPFALHLDRAAFKAKSDVRFVHTQCWLQTLSSGHGSHAEFKHGIPGLIRSRVLLKCVRGPENTRRNNSSGISTPCWRNVEITSAISMLSAIVESISVSRPSPDNCA